MLTIFLATAYVISMTYSAMCAPDVFFRLFRFRNTPEYEFAYLLSCMFMALTLLGAAGRAAFALHDARRAT